MLGVTLPSKLRKLYLECDGFREDRGNAKYLFSLLDEGNVGSLVTITRHFWHEVTVPCLDGQDHCLGDSEPLAEMLEACEQLMNN